jgi:hypothetical protein
MGSFNETCALSNINIGYGDKVKLLFLTESPSEKSRGCYHTNKWFCRTPPINGTYDDYGRCKFEPDAISNLIEVMFDKDAVERPYGHNPYHDPPVIHGNGLAAYLNAAWEGRLYVHDTYTCSPKEVPANFPTWRRVHDILQKAGLPLQIEKKDTEGTGGKKGYNAQPIARGVICLTWNAYEGEEKNLKKAEKLLSEHYDCLFTYRIPDHKSDPHLMVVPKGAFNDPTLLFDKQEAEKVMKEGAGYDRSYRELQVLAVMVRQDVWDAYSGQVIVPSWGDKTPVTTELHYNKLKNIWDEQIENDKKWKAALKKVKEGDITATRDVVRPSATLYGTEIRSVFMELPFQRMIGAHIGAAIEDKKFKSRADLLQRAAELAQVEIVMERLHQPWYIPPLGGQEPEWELRTDILQKVAAISAGCLQKEKDEYED